MSTLSAALIAVRLRRSMADVGPLAPPGAARIAALDEAGRDLCDARS